MNGLLAQAPINPEIPWTTFLNFGVLGLVFVLTLFGWMYPKPMIDHLQRENDRLRADNEKVRAENTQLRTSIEEKVVPALVRVTDLLGHVSEKGIT